MKLKVEVSEMNENEICNLLSAALSGSPWWLVHNCGEAYKKAKGDTIEDKLADVLLSGGTVVLEDMEEGTEYNLTLEKLYKGINKNIENGASMNVEDYDLIEADRVLQYALLGDVLWA